MIALIRLLLALLASSLRSKVSLEAENAALRQQIIVLRRKLRGRIRLSNGDRLFFRLALSAVSVDPQRPSDHSSRHPCAMAPRRLSPVLAVEIAPPPWPPPSREGPSGDGDHELVEAARRCRLSFVG
jgi:hypothetical protein